MSSESTVATSEPEVVPAGRKARAKMAKVKQQSAKIRFTVKTFGENGIGLPDIESRLKGVTLDKRRVSAGKAQVVPDDLHKLARDYRQTMYKIFNRGTIFIGEGRRIVPLGLESREWHEKEAQAQQEANAIAERICTQENLDRINQFNRNYWTDIVRVPVEGCENLQELVGNYKGLCEALETIDGDLTDEHRAAAHARVENAKQSLEAATNAAATELEYQRVVGWAIPQTVEAMRARFSIRVVLEDMPTGSGDLLDVYDFAARFVEAGIEARIEEADEIADEITRELSTKVVQVMGEVKDQLANGKVIKPVTFGALRDELDKLRYAGEALHPDIINMLPRITRKVRISVDEASRQMAEGGTFTKAIREESAAIVSALDELGEALKNRVNTDQVRERYGLNPRRIRVRTVPTAPPAQG